jgi:threonine-phosphate decarboxylase
VKRFEHGGDIYTHPGVVDFSASLNPLGMPKAAREALLASVDACEFYPDPYARELVRALADFEQVDEAWVVPCAGATDAIARLCQVVNPQRALVFAPCYGGYEQALARLGVEACVALLTDFVESGL